MAKQTNELIAQLGKSLAQIRLCREIQQVELAAASGVSLRTIQRLEKGGTVGLDAVVAIAHVLGVYDRVLDCLSKAAEPAQPVTDTQSTKSATQSAPKQRVRRPNPNK